MKELAIFLVAAGVLSCLLAVVLLFIFTAIYMFFNGRETKTVLLFSSRLFNPPGLISTPLFFLGGSFVLFLASAIVLAIKVSNDLPVGGKKRRFKLRF